MSDGGPRPPGLPDLGAAGLTRGRVEVVLRPVRSVERAHALRSAVDRIGGIHGTTVLGHDGPVLRLGVDVGRPIPLGSELRRALPRDVVSCTYRDGVFTVALAPAPGPGRRAISREPHDGPRAVQGVRLPGPIAAASHGPGGGPERGPTVAPSHRTAPTAASGDVLVGALRAMSDVSVLVFDPDLRVRTLTGHAHAEAGGPSAVGAPVHDVLAASRWDRVREALSSALAGETTVVDIDGGDGEALFESTCGPVHGEDRIVGGMIVTRDVTDRRRDQMLLSELQEVFDLTFEDSPICQALLTPDGRWLRLNRALRELLRRDEASLAGRHVREITHPADRGTEQRLVDDLRTGRRDRDAVPVRLLRDDGRALPVHVRASVVRAPDGAARGTIVQVLDAELLGGRGGTSLATR